MERAVAIKKLVKILGKDLGYQVDPKAADADDRAAAREELKLAIPERDALYKAKNARMEELLQGDAEFQWLKETYKAAATRCERLSAITRQYRFTAGTTNRIGFLIKAQGDSWEEVIKKLQEKART